MRQQEQIRTVEQSFPVKHAGAWPPDLSALAGLGFDSISSSQSACTIKKVQSAGLSGKPHLFIEIALHRKSISIRYSVPCGSDESLRALAAGAMLLRVLSLAEGFSAEAAKLSGILLPAIEQAAKASSLDFELLHKKYSDLRRESAEISSKNSKLASSSEESAAATLELERQVLALGQRIKTLESVSDVSLRELVLDWISAHRGSFNAAAFSSATGIAPSRAEEGLEQLLQSGAISRLSGPFAVHGAESHGTYQKQEKGLLKSFGAAVRGVRLLPKAKPQP